MAKRRDRQGLTEAEFLAAYDPDRYPKPAVTADIVILNDRDEVLLVRRGSHPFLGCWALPGGFANPDEPLAQTAARELAEETGMTGLPLTLIGVFSEPGRDPRGWTISAAYGSCVRKAAVIPRAGDDAAAAAWWRIDAAGQILHRGDEAMTFQDLAFDHAAILTAALAQRTWDE